MSLRLLSVVAVLAAVLVSLVPLAHGATSGAAGAKTTEPEVYQDVNVTITDRKIVLSERRAERGEGVTLHIKNTGTKPHSFGFAGRGALSLSNSGLSTPALKPGQTSHPFGLHGLARRDSVSEHRQGRRFNRHARRLLRGLKLRLVDFRH